MLRILGVSSDVFLGWEGFAKVCEKDTGRREERDGPFIKLVGISGGVRGMDRALLS